MAEAILAETRIKLIFDAGMNEEGETIYRSRVLGNIKIDSTPDQLHQAVSALVSLSRDPLSLSERHDVSQLFG